MCDYSLEMYASRPARQKEKYVTTRFLSGSTGLAAPGDCTTAICVQYDTRLNLEDIPADVQTRIAGLGVVPTSEMEVTFCRIERGCYRDGVRFDNGKQLSLQLLGVGVGVALVPAATREEIAPAMSKEPETAVARELDLVG